MLFSDAYMDCWIIHFFWWGGGGVTRHDHQQQSKIQEKQQTKRSVFYYAIKDCHNEVSVLVFCLFVCVLLHGLMVLLYG